MQILIKNYRGNYNLIEVGLGNYNKSEEHYLPKKSYPTLQEV